MTPVAACTHELPRRLVEQANRALLGPEDAHGVCDHHLQQFIERNGGVHGRDAVLQHGQAQHLLGHEAGVHFGLLLRRSQQVIAFRDRAGQLSDRMDAQVHAPG